MHQFFHNPRFVIAAETRSAHVVSLVKLRTKYTAHGHVASSYTVPGLLSMLLVLASACDDAFGPTSVVPPADSTPAAELLVISPTAITTAVPGTVSFNATGDKATVRWESSNTRIAEISTSGVLVARFPGTITITARRGGQTRIANVTVVATRLEIAGTPAALPVSRQATLSAIVRDGVDSVLHGVPTLWTSASPTTASVHPITGVVIGISVGTTTISAHGGGVSSSVALVVDPAPMIAITVIGAGTGSGRVMSTPAGIDCAIQPSGTIGACTGMFPAGTRLTLKAFPGENGVGFLSWSSCTKLALSCELIVDHAREITATFSSGLAFSSLRTVGAFACGLEEQSGLAYCFGDNHAGALGIGSADFPDGPVRVGDGSLRFSGLSVGYYATCGIETATALAFCWGWNGDGELGNGTREIQWTPTLVGNGNMRFSSISPADGTTCGVELETQMGYCWGRAGRVGNGTFEQRSVPTRVAGSVRYSTISTSDTHTCGLESGTGRAYCWGTNEFGQLGDATVSARLTPTLVSGVNNGFSSISAGAGFTCAIERDTALPYCWGKNSLGQLGIGSITSRTEPVLVSGGHRLSSISAGVDEACGIETSTGSALCWGASHVSQLGAGTDTNRRSPTLVGGGRRFRAISTWYGSCGVEADTGAGFCWGRGSSVPALVPVPGISR
jgi:hypothetical protein